ncbi:FapA family protein [Desulfobacterales bacterium HSG17]|nr:FapA family protein [Desulfobacterales bacterium HSG17]
MAAHNSSKHKIPFIGLLAVKTKFITKDQLAKGLEQCSGADNPTLALKEYFLSTDLISAQKMKKLLLAVKKLNLRQAELRFGAIAIKKGFINQSVLKLALEEQKNNIQNKKKSLPVGDILVEAGMMTEKQRDYILKLQKKKTLNAEKTVAKDVTETKEKKPPEAPAEKMPEETKKEAPPALLAPEIIEGGIKLEILNDFMAALLTKTDEFDQKITVTQVKQTLFDKDIVAGIVADEMIEGFITSSGFKTKAFKVAQGISPLQGKDSTIKFFFDRDYLKAGGVTNDGAIDFKDRGEMPFVESGTILAEKTAIKESRNGKNIYGETVEITPALDIELKIGKGAQLSDDGLKILAEVQGFPVYTMSKHIAVYQEYTTEGDVDYETGHINYDGNVNVNGRIKSGFKVEGNNIQALALDGGTVTADENVNIAGGINEGTIYSRGNICAKFINNSKLLCLGDVIIEKEIVDSDIECSGKCVVANGKLISSRVTAKMGVQAKNIGTDMSDPNILKVGHDIFTQKELEKNKEKMDKVNKKIEKLNEKREKLETDNVELEKQITELAHVQDRSQLEAKQITSNLVSIQKDGNDAQAIGEHKNKIEQLKKDAQKAEEDLNVCFEKCDKIEPALENIEMATKTLKKDLDDLEAEKSNILLFTKDNPGKPVVIAQGAILDGTVIKGLHCEKRLAELTRHAKIMEVQSMTKEGQAMGDYEIQVGSI